MPAALHDQALVAVDKLDKIGREGVAAELATRGIPADAAERLLAAFDHPLAKSATPEPAAHESMIVWAREQVGAHPAGLAAVANLAEILRLCRATSAGAHVTLDPSLARGLSYYTGAIMETAVPDLAGSLGGGGRYDGLIGMFSGEAIPACGFSLGLERILVVMAERDMFPAGLQTGRRGRDADAVRRGADRRRPAAGRGPAPRRAARRGVSRAGQARQAVQVRRRRAASGS